MDAVFVRTMTCVRTLTAAAYLPGEHHTPTHTIRQRHTSIILDKKILGKTVLFFPLRTMLVYETDCQLRMENLFFPPLKRKHTHSHRDPSQPFFLIKNAREKKGARPPKERSTHEKR